MKKLLSILPTQSLIYFFICGAGVLFFVFFIIIPTQKTAAELDKEYTKIYKYNLTRYAMEAKQKLANNKKKGAPKISKRLAWMPYFRFKKQFSWVKYSYAITIHKAQGSTFRNVYVINADCNKLQWNDLERNKLKYVAFTRASHLLKII